MVERDYAASDESFSLNGALSRQNISGSCGAAPSSAAEALRRSSAQEVAGLGTEV